MQSSLAQRVLPHDLDAEAVVISAALLVADELDSLTTTLDEPHFYSDANRIIWRAIVALHRDGRQVDATLVAVWLREQGYLERVGGTPYLARFVDEIPATVQLEPYVAVLRDRSQKRQLIRICQRFAAEAATTTDPALGLLNDAELALSEVATTAVGDHLVPVGRVAEDHVKLLAEAQAAGVRLLGVPTGFTRLDDLMGGLAAGDLTIVAGRPGMGKTSFVANVAANVVRPKGMTPSEDAVAFFSLEMPAPQMALRFLCAERGLDFAMVRQNKLSSLHWEQLLAGVRDLHGYPLWLDDTAGIDLHALRSRCRKLKRDIEVGRSGSSAKRLRVIVVDYLQLMTGERTASSNRENEVAGLARGLKGLAKELDVAVIALSQLNRAVETRGQKKEHRPQLSDLRESGAIEQDADNVLFVYRPSYYDEHARKNDAEVIIGKQRNGPTETALLTFRGDSMRFFDRAIETYDDFSGDFDEQG